PATASRGTSAATSPSSAGATPSCSRRGSGPTPRRSARRSAPGWRASASCWTRRATRPPAAPRRRSPPTTAPSRPGSSRPTRSSSSRWTRGASPRRPGRRRGCRGYLPLLRYRLPPPVKDTIRIASGQGFWGDLQRAPLDQARKGPIDYLVMDYLAEVTMSILQKQKLRDPSAGYARDFVEVVTELAPDIAAKGFTIISNAGGVNPVACAEAIVEGMRGRGVTGLKVAVVTGDD